MRLKRNARSNRRTDAQCAGLRRGFRNGDPADRDPNRPEAVVIDIGSPCETVSFLRWLQITQAGSRRTRFAELKPVCPARRPLSFPQSCRGGEARCATSPMWLAAIGTRNGTAIAPSFATKKRAARDPHERRASAPRRQHGSGSYGMPQVFPPRANATSRAVLLAAAGTGPLVLWIGLVLTRSSFGTAAGVMREQPVPFSHEHHVGRLGIDCRYCHTTVEHAAYAGMPDTKTCMNCHSQIWVGSDVLKPVRDSYSHAEPLHWRRIHNLPGFVYFDHSIHVHKGIGCSSCHGRIDEMPFTYQRASLLMEWCLDCHRQPERHIRPREEVFNMPYQPGDDPARSGVSLCNEYGVKNATQITSCSVCHR